MIHPEHIGFLTHYGELYGANRSLLDLATDLRDRYDVRSHLFVPSAGPFAQLATTLGHQVEVIEQADWMTKRHFEGGLHHRARQWWRYRMGSAAHQRILHRAADRIADRVREQGLDLLHANSAAVGVVEHLLGKVDVPLVWHIREMPEQHYGFHLEAGRGRYVRALSSAAALITNSRAVEQDLRSYVGDHPHIHVVYNGAYTTRTMEHLPRVEAPPSKVPFILLMAGVLHPMKRMDEGLRAMAELVRIGVDVRMRIAGGGRSDVLRDLTNELGIRDRVEFLGYVPDMRSFYASGHCLLVCARKEAMGRVTVEAMAHGLPVIGFADGGTRELVEHERTGLLYSKGLEDLVQCLRMLIADPDLAQRLGARAALMARERYTIEGCTDRIMSIYAEVLSRHAERA